MNEKLIGIGIIVFGIVSFFMLNRLLYDNLDYCVTHVCGCTHNIGWQDVLWMLHPLHLVLSFVLGINMFMLKRKIMLS